MAQAMVDLHTCTGMLAREIGQCMQSLLLRKWLWGSDPFAPWPNEVHLWMMFLLSFTPEGLQQSIDGMQGVCASMGLTIRPTKIE